MFLDVIPGAISDVIPAPTKQVGAQVDKLEKGHLPSIGQLGLTSFKLQTNLDTR